MMSDPEKQTPPNNLAVILARGGSKRIPRKNIIDFMSKPMLAWTIEAALKSGRFAHVVVSTDDEEIAQIAREYGAEVPFVRTENADDHATSSEAVLTCLHQAEVHYGQVFDTVCQLMANCPLRDGQDIGNAYDQFQSQQALFQISCFAFGWMNPWWAIRSQPDNRFEFLFPEAAKQRSQDQEPLYCPTGAVWIANSEAFKQQKTFYGEPVHWFELDWKSAVDIDEWKDLDFAKAAFLVKNNQA